MSQIGLSHDRRRYKVDVTRLPEGVTGIMVQIDESIVGSKSRVSADFA